MLCGCQVDKKRAGAAGGGGGGGSATGGFNTGGFNTPVSEGGSCSSLQFEGYCVDHDFYDEEEYDDGDAWLRGIEACSVPGVVPQHVHIKVASEEKQSKRRLF